MNGEIGDYATFLNERNGDFANITESEYGDFANFAVSKYGDFADERIQKKDIQPVTSLERARRGKTRVDDKRRETRRQVYGCRGIRQE